MRHVPLPVCAKHGHQVTHGLIAGLNIWIKVYKIRVLKTALHQPGGIAIRSFPYKNKDTLNAMIQYYILWDKANDHAGIWYDGSIVRLLFPKANLASQRISDFLKSIGRRESVEQFFEAHIKWIKENVCSDPAILIDSTGMPNNIHFPLTAISNHNGKLSRDARMTTIIQRDTGYPLMFRITPGNINDISTITRSTVTLAYMI